MGTLDPAIIAVFGSAAMLVVWALAGSRQPAEGDPSEVNVHSQQLEEGALTRLVKPAFTTLGRGIAHLLPPDQIKAMRRRIILAGLQHTWSIEKAMALKGMTIVAGFGAAYGILSYERSRLTVIAAVLFVGCGYFAVEYVLDKKATARQTEIRQDLPDILDQISVCVEAGLGFDAALARSAASNDNPLGHELTRTLQDIRLGAPRARALNSLLDRTDVQDLRLFVRALIQAERSGIPIAKVLNVQSDEVREKRRQAAEERAMRLPVMLIMPLVLCILPSLFTVIMGPAVLRMINEGAIQ